MTDKLNIDWKARLADPTPLSYSDWLCVSGMSGSIVSELEVDAQRPASAEFAHQAGIGLSQHGAYRQRGMLIAALASRTLSRWEDAVAFAESALSGEDPVTSARAKMVIGAVLFETGRTVESLARYEEALKEFESTGERLRWAQCQFNIGLNLFHSGHLGEALVRYEQARTEFRSLDSKLFAAICTMNLGNVSRHLGRHEDAIEQYKSARAEFDSLGDWRSANCLINAGNSLFDLGRCDDAISMFERAYETLSSLGERNRAAGCLVNLSRVRDFLGAKEAAVQLLADALSEFETLGDRKRVGECLLNLGRIEQDIGRLIGASESFASADDPRGVMQSELALGVLHLANDGLDSAGTAFENSIEALRCAQKRMPEAESAIDMASASLILIGAIAKLGFTQSKLAKAFVDMDRVRRVLADIEGVFEIDEWTATARQKRALIQIAEFQSEILAIVLQGRCNEPTGMVISNSPTILEGNQLLLENLIANRDVSTAIAALRERIIDPLLDAVEGPSRLTVFASGSLASIPIELLLQGRADMTVEHGWSTSSGEEPGYQIGPDDSALFVGVSKFSQPDLPDLPSVKLEMREFANQFKNSRSLIDQSATVEDVACQLRNAEVVHIATHGKLNARNPAMSSLILNDGELLAWNIAEIKMHAKLVVLATCDSGAARRQSAHAQAGLADAFLRAGCNAVVSTRWKVADEAAALFCSEFYQALFEGQNATEALRQAASQVRSVAKFSHPHFWASWTVAVKNC